MTTSKARWRLPLLTLLALGPALMTASAEDPTDPSTGCAACHENLARQFATTVHGRIQSFEVQGGQVGCVACHGDGQAHMDSGDPELISGLGNEALPEQTAEVCTTCHRSKSLHDWVGGVHPLNGVGCSDCHKVHANPGKVGRNKETCIELCHTDVRAQFTYPSHHPVLEGHMTCGACHDPHGTSIGMLKTEERPQEMCFECHRDLAGPFVFEHEPVFEGCDTCHEPHGAVASRLLVQTEPFLCLQCHEMHFHAGLEGEGIINDPVNQPANTGYVQAFDPAFDPDTDRPTYPGGWVPNPGGASSYKMAFTTKCTQCHTRVHGTDDPSQTVSGRGMGLAR